MKSNKITRKDFISKTSKCAGNIICTPIILTLLQSCSKPNPVDSIDNSEISFVAECPCHGARFDQNGNVISGPTSQALITYNILDINNDSFIIRNNNIDYEVFFSDHPELKETNGISSTLGQEIIDDDQNQLDTKGLLFYRKNEQEIIALSRACTHQGCPIEPFEPV